MRRAARVALSVTACAMTLVALTGSAEAGSGVKSCPGRPGYPTDGVASILSVRSMSCGEAARYYRRHDGDQHTPIQAGRVRQIGKFRCAVYQDLTPPGPSDTWVRVRCVHSAQAFRYEYGV